MDKYYFKNDTKLTNYYLCKVKLNGLEFNSSEAAYHSQKFEDYNIKKVLTLLTPDESKHVSRELKRLIRSDWENVKYNLMKEVVMEKFKQNEDCLKELINTGDLYLVEDTTGWHDNTWGECTCVECTDKEHHNYLGKILMEVREKLSNNKKYCSF